MAPGGPASRVDDTDSPTVNVVRQRMKTSGLREGYGARAATTAISKAAAQIRKKHEVDTKDNEWWLTQLRDAYRHGDDFTSVMDIDAMLTRVTSDHIRATAARMVRGKPHIAISLWPEASPARSP